MPHLFETMGMPNGFRRAQDRWMLGRLDIDAAPIVPGTRRILAVRHGHTGRTSYQDVPTLEAGVEWIRHAPDVVDLTQYPATHNVYGPILARWGNASIVGLVWSSSYRIAQGLGKAQDIRSFPFVGIGPDGTICAKMHHHRGVWSITVARTGGSIKRTRTKLADAITVFATECVRHITGGSRHEIMEILHDAPGLVARAETFLARRDGWKRQMTHGLDNAPVALHDLILEPWILMRQGDRFPLGRIVMQGGVYSSLRTGLRHGVIEDLDSLGTPSLDQAVAFLADSPHAPDLDAFPNVAFLDYGKILWTLPLCSLVGMVGCTNMQRRRPDVRFKLISPQRSVIGSVSQDPETLTWVAARIVHDTEFVIYADACLQDLLSVVQDMMVRLHAPDQHAALEAGAQDALAGMMNFIEHRDELIVAFEGGGGVPD